MGSPLHTAGSYLLALARRNSAIYAAHPQTRAILLMGSAAEGQSDFFSDLDMAIYYDELPSDEELADLRRQNQGSERIWLMGDRADGSCAEAYLVGGVECQFAHTTVATWERDMAAVLEKLDVT